MKYSKKIFLFVTLLIAMTAGAQTPLALTMEDFDIKPGETKTVYIAMQNEGYDVIAIEFKMQLPEGLSTKKKSFKLVEDRIGSGEDEDGDVVDSEKTVNAAKNAAGYWTISIFSMADQLPFSGTEGNVIALDITADATMTIGEQSICLYDIELSTKTAPYYPEEYRNKLMVYQENVTITMAHAQRTFSCAQPLDFTGTGLKAYIATDYQEGKATLTRVGSAAAGTGLFLVGTAGEEYVVPYTTTAAATEGNLLRPVLEPQVVPQTEGDYTNYLYGEVDGVRGFHKSSGQGTVAAGKAYLQLLTSVASDARSVGIAFSDETNGIDDLPIDDSRFDGFAVYDLQGRRIVNSRFVNRKSSKGVYVIGGKKAVMK